MRFGKHSVLPFALVLLALSGHAALAPRSTTESYQPQLEMYRATRMVGAKVENLDGEYLGRINNFVIQPKGGRVEFVVISSGGFLGVGAKMKIVPAAALFPGTAKEGVLALDISKPKWRSAPGFKKGAVSAFGAEPRRQAVNAYYEAAASRKDKVAAPPLARQAAVSGGPPTGPQREAGPDETSQLELASDVIGRDVVNRRREVIGRVTDLLVDLSQSKPLYAIVAPGRLLKGQHGYAVPLESLRLDSDEKATLDADEALFASAPPFDAARWSGADAANSRTIFLYRDREPDNTGLNYRDHKSAGGLTPLRQSESKIDRRLTQSIRRTLMNDSALSMTAKNVKIITIRSKVTLRGPVHTEREKRIINEHAALIAGADNVENQIEVEHR